MKDVIANVNSVELINQNVYKVSLHLEATSFIAGQYLLVPLLTGEQVPYSIGCAPHELPTLTLYIQVSEETSLAHKVVEHFQNNSEVSLNIPGGDCHLENGVLGQAPKHLLLIGGGTGFSQIKSLHDTLVKQGYQGKVSVYWGLRTYQDIFEESWIEEAQRNPDIDVNIVINEAHSEWQGRTGWLYEAVIADHPNLSDYHAFLCGSVGMVYGTLEQLEQKGLEQDKSYSDVYAYAPRP
ncbi:NAD(P)H-flavin reductase [Marinomonas epiphytica]